MSNIDITPVLHELSRDHGITMTPPTDPIYKSGAVRFTIHPRIVAQKSVATDPDPSHVPGLGRTAPGTARVKTATVPGGHSAGSDPEQAIAMHRELLRVLGHDPSSKQLKMLLSVPGLERHRVADPMIHGAWEEGGKIYADPHIPIIVPRGDAERAADALGGAFRQAAIGGEYATTNRPNTLVIAAHHPNIIGPDDAKRIMDAVTSSGSGFAPDVKPLSHTSYHFLYPYTGDFENSAGGGISDGGKADIIQRVHALRAALSGAGGRVAPLMYTSHGAKTALLAEGAAERPLHPAAQQVADAYDSIYGRR